MKKILFIINFLNNGGPAKVLQNLIHSLNKEKYNLSVLTLIDQNDITIVKELEKEHVRVIELKLSKSWKTLIKNKKEIINIIHDMAPDIIHTHGIVPTFFVSNRKIRAYKITTIHNNVFEDSKFTYGKYKGKLFTGVHLNCLKKFDNVICCSQTSYEAIKNKLNNVSFVRNGVDIDSVDSSSSSNIREELNIPSDAIVFIYAGCISKLKRVIELLKLFNTCRKYNEYLIILGDGPLKQECESLSLDNVKIVGFKGNIMDYFRASDVYVSNSSSEGFSISIIEALGSGLHIFLSNIPSHEECFLIDNSYYLGEDFSENNFADKKEILLKKYSKTNKKEIMKFQKKYLSSFSMAKEYEVYYERYDIK